MPSAKDAEVISINAVLALLWENFIPLFVLIIAQKRSYINTENMNFCVCE